MSWLPGWNSIEGASRWEDVFFWIGLVFLVLLAGSEIVSKYYGWRKDELIATAQRMRAQAQERNDNDVEARRVVERAELEDKLLEATDRATALEIRQTWRSITFDQRNSLVAALRNAPKGPVIVMHVPEDEPRQYASLIVDVLRAAGFSDIKEQNSPATLGSSGDWILVKDDRRVPPHAVRIQLAFDQVGVTLDGQYDPQHVPNAGTVVISIGTRKP